MRPCLQDLLGEPVRGRAARRAAADHPARFARRHGPRFRRPVCRQPCGKGRFDELLRANNAVGDSTWPALQQRLETSLAGIDTDFVLTEKNRHLLDLAAYLLVQAKLAGDIAAWNAAAHDAKPVTGVTCH
jgi:hypothetical protein